MTAINNSNFVSATNLQQIVGGAAIIGLLAIGETMVIVTRNVDLSVGSVLGLSAYAAGLLFERHPDVPILVVVLAGLGIGMACGIVNGAIVTIARVPSLVVTLGTLYVIRGIDGAWAGGHQVGAFALPDSFNKIGFETFLGVPYLGWILLGARRRSRRTGCGATAPGATSTRSARTPRPRGSPASRSAAASSSRSSLSRRDRRRHRRALALEVRLGRRDRRPRATSSR